MRRKLHHFLHTYICRKSSCTCTCAGTLLHIYVCRNTSCTYIHVHGAGKVPAHHVQEFFLPIPMFRNTIYMCRNTACTYRCAGILPANTYVQEYFLPIHIYMYMGQENFLHHVQEFFLPINMLRNTSCTYTCVETTTYTYTCVGTLPAHIDVQEFFLHI